MAAKQKTPPIPESRELSSDQARSAITTLRTRIGELKEMNPDMDDTSWRAAETRAVDKIQSSLGVIYGRGTVEYQQFCVHHLYEMGDLVMGAWGEGAPRSTTLKARRGGITAAIGKIETAIELLQELVIEAPVAHDVFRAYEKLQLHSRIAEVASSRFQSKHYSDAVEKAVLALVLMVKERSGCHAEDGDVLMTKVFSAKNPVLKFNDLQSRSDEDEQKGFMFLFQGAVAGLRNPRAHIFVEDDPERALEAIAFVSFLAKLLESTKPS